MNDCHTNSDRRKWIKEMAEEETEGSLYQATKELEESIKDKGHGVGWPYVVEDKDQPLDMVNSPPHYTAGLIECIDAIEAALTPEEFRGYCKGNAIKYIWRERHKGGNESVSKSKWYLRRISNGR